MTTRTAHVRHLSLREKHALWLLRGLTLDVPATTAAAFATLNRTARASRFAVDEPQAPYVTRDERLILGWLTILQRQRADEHVWNGSRLEFELTVAVRRCAWLLDRAGYRLDFRNARHAGMTALAGDAVETLALQSRVLRFVSENGTAARRDLTAFGASPSLLRAMCKRRLLRRVAHGHYGLGPIIATVPAAAAIHQSNANS